MKIKTVIDTSAAKFDEEVNAALAEGYMLGRRMSDHPGGFCAELVLLDPPAEPEPVAGADPIDLARQLVYFCAGTPREVCQKSECPLSFLCAAMAAGKAIDEWPTPTTEG